MKKLKMLFIATCMSFVAFATFSAEASASCYQYPKTEVVNGVTQSGYAVICLQANGTWKTTQSFVPVTAGYYHPNYYSHVNNWMAYNPYYYRYPYPYYNGVNGVVYYRQ
ncbi:MAG: hypothetical protein AAF549_05285 [Pseudomonadota bacterium]